MQIRKKQTIAVFLKLGWCRR